MQAKITIALLVILILCFFFWLFHVVLPMRAERKRLERKVSDYPKAYRSSAYSDEVEFLLSLDETEEAISN